MVQAKDRNACAELKRRLAIDLPVLEVRLFGSRARGDASADSDMDVFVKVEKNTRAARNHVRRTAWELGLEEGLVISTLVFGREELTDGPMRSSAIVQNILREGLLV